MSTITLAPPATRAARAVARRPAARPAGSPRVPTQRGPLPALRPVPQPATGSAADPAARQTAAPAPRHTPALRTPVPVPREAALAVPVAGVRLTRRGQVVVVLAGLLAALAFALFAGADSVATEQPGLDAPAELVTVGTGETLWDLAAERTPPGGDVRAMMRRIENINVLESAALEAGQQVMVPAAG